MRASPDPQTTPWPPDPCRSGLAALLYGECAEDSAGSHGLVAAPRIGLLAALRIYRRNLYGGVEQHFRTNFPMLAKYLGPSALAYAVGRYLQEQPPSSPVFTIYAASFPGFLTSLPQGGPRPGAAGTGEAPAPWLPAGMLGAIDFIYSNAHRAGQSLQTELRYFELWRALRSPHSDGHDGAYRRPEFHPDAVAAQAARSVCLVTAYHDGELMLGLAENGP